jgi:hypothetical protein
LTGDFLEGDAGQHIASVAVLPPFAGREVNRLPGPPIQQCLMRDGVAHIGKHIVLRPEVADAGGVV